MADGIQDRNIPRAGTPLSAYPRLRLPVFALGASLGAFFAITFVLCVLFDLWFPNLAMYTTWEKLLPGFVWLDWTSFFLCLVESIAYGWYIALIFGPLFNLSVSRFGG